MIEPSIVVENVHKSFALGRSKIGSLKTLALWGRGGDKKKSVDVLNGVSLTVQRGESVALIGRNGAGKSTLLMIIAQIYRPTLGIARVNGRIAPLLELGAGFHPDLTGKDNVVFNAMLLGLSRKEIEAKLPEIIEFADIGDYIGRPTRTYSSGMQARLGFSVAIHINPDVLIVDEVLSVGDLAFVRKCQDKVQEYKESGGTILLVSHSLDTIRRVSDRVIWLESGKVHDEGTPDEVLPRYSAFMGAATQLEEEEASRHVHPMASQETLAQNAQHEAVRYFIHIPMTVGAAFRTALRKVFDENELREVYRLPAEQSLSELVKTPLHPDCKVIVGHYGTSLDKAIGVPGRYSALFRHPLQQALSLYRQERRNKKSLFHTFANELSVTEFFDARLSPFFENPTAKILAGTLFQDEYWHESEELEESELLERAMATLSELEYIGIVEDLEASMIELSEFLGHEVVLEDASVDPDPLDPASLTAEEREQILAHFDVDLRLYEAAIIERDTRSAARKLVQL